MKFKLVYAFVFLFLVGFFVSATNGNGNGANNSSGCKNLYWIDYENKNCEQKEFCGAYMYYGLQTFENKNDCENLVNESFCNIDSDCGCGTWKANGECTVGNKNFVNTTSQCPDYCGSLGGNLKTKCENHVCVQKDEKENLLNKTNFILSNGRNVEIKIMPETASEKAIERLGELNFTIELKEVGVNKTAYEIKGEKQGKFLGLFKVRANVSVEVDAENGEVIREKKPWWSFFASGI